MLDLTLNLTYGARAGDFDDALTNSLLNSLYAITSVRGSTADYTHFVPLLRILPERSSNVMEAVKERQRCIDIFYGQYLRKVADGETPTCIVSSLGADKLTLEEIHGTCMSLLQAAPDTGKLLSILNCYFIHDSSGPMTSMGIHMRISVVGARPLGS
jgi:phenylacetate 2-hydroxylase